MDAKFFKKTESVLLKCDFFYDIWKLLSENNHMHGESVHGLSGYVDVGLSLFNGIFH